MAEAVIQPNQRFFVKGQVQYSDVSQLVDGERLEQQREIRGNDNLQPYTSITVINPEIVTRNGQKTETEMAVESNHFYTTKREPNVMHFQGTRNKYKNARRPYTLPWIAVGALKTKHVRQLQLHKGEEVVQGRTVILCLRTFQGRQNKVGTILDGVVVPLTDKEVAENPRAPFATRDNQDISQELSQLGLTLDNPTVATEPTDIPASKLNTRDLPGGFSADEKPAAKPAAQTTTTPAPKQAAQSTSASQDKSDDGVGNLWNEFDNTDNDAGVDGSPFAPDTKPAEPQDSSKQAADDWFAN